jgi:hypothetical protein
VREKYRIDPHLMGELMEKIGPVDWRHPAAHTLYWFAAGAIRSRCRSPDLSRIRLTPADVDAILVRPGSRAALEELVRNGRITLDASGELYRREPEYRLLPALERAIRCRTGDEPAGQKNLEELMPPFKQVLAHCVEYAWFNGDPGRALDLYKKLARLEREMPGDPEDPGRLEPGGGPEHLILRRYSRVLERAESLAEGFRTLLSSVYREDLAAGRSDRARRRLGMIRRLYGQKSREDSGLPSWEVLLMASFHYTLALPPLYADPFGKVFLWKHLPEMAGQLLPGDPRPSLPVEARALFLDQLRRYGIDRSFIQKRP